MLYRSKVLLAVLGLSWAAHGGCRPTHPGAPSAPAGAAGALVAPSPSTGATVPASSAAVGAVWNDPACPSLRIALSGQKPAGEESSSDGPDTVRQAEKGQSCQLADDNLAAAGKAILAAAGRPRPALKSVAWDGQGALQYGKLIDDRFVLSPAEKDRLRSAGFVVPGRFQYSTFGWAFHELYQSQIPLYVSVDAILHAVYASNDKLIAALETDRLQPLLSQALQAMHCALAAIAATLPPDTARDADLYLTVARSLLAGAPVRSVLGSDGDAAGLVAQIDKHEGLRTLNLFGRARVVDLGVYAPRGHYDGALAPFFRAAMWLSRLELNLVSRSCRSSQPGATLDGAETPREVALALTLLQLAERGAALPAMALLDRSWTLLAGQREDVSLSDLQALRQKAGLPALPPASDATVAALRGAIGSGFQRTARLFPMPEGARDLPVIFTLLGPRVVPDTAALHLLVHDQIPNRHMPQAADLAYVLGHDRAKSLLTADLAQFPTLATHLDRARQLLSSRRAAATGDLYSAWLGAIAGLAQTPPGTLPSFMARPPFADLRVASTVAAFGQLRHNYVLLAGQEYGAAGCEIPDGFVDPAPAVYDALLEYARRGDTVLSELDPGDVVGARDYFARLSRTLRVLRTIVDDELAGRALSPDQRRFLSMVAEFHPPSTGGPATYTGWYFDLFRSRREEGLSDASFIADYYTSGHTAQVAYAGAGEPQLGFFVVDTGGPPRLMVGPVARAFSATGPTSARFSDADVSGPRVPKSAPWADSYTVAAPAIPPLTVEQQGRDFVVRSTRPLGPVTLTAMDHHRRPLRSVTLPVAEKDVTFRFPGGKPIEAVRVQIGSFVYVAVAHENAVEMSPINFTLPPPPAPPPAAEQ